MTLSLIKPVIWRQIQKENFTSVEEVADFLELTEEKRVLLNYSPRFVLNLPRRLAEKRHGAVGTLDQDCAGSDRSAAWQ